MVSKWRQGGWCAFCCTGHSGGPLKTKIVSAEASTIFEFHLHRAEAICTNLPASILTPSPSATAVEKNLYTCVLMVICVPPGGGKGYRFFVYMFRRCLF